MIWNSKRHQIQSNHNCIPQKDESRFAGQYKAERTVQNILYYVKLKEYLSRELKLIFV